MNQHTVYNPGEWRPSVRTARGCVSIHANGGLDPSRSAGNEISKRQQQQILGLPTSDLHGDQSGDVSGLTGASPGKATWIVSSMDILLVHHTYLSSILLEYPDKGRHAGRHKDAVHRELDLQPTSGYPGAWRVSMGPEVVNRMILESACRGSCARR